ncbi:MAG: hypothetical protein IPJ81_16675 [Chitinophagaceae bacterium]|nr:hypothetical protein [Chitinophagaceae bacterium]
MNILVIKWLRHIICLPVFILFLSITGFGQIKNTLINGMYLQWGYNTECYTKSNIHVNDVVNGVPHRFTIYNAKAHDRNDLDGIIKNPVELTVPQYSYRVGFYLNKAHTTAIEINFDHTKYIVSDNQRLHVKGYIGAAHFDTDTTLLMTSFI